ncbi:hypothetical protein SFRURICE_012696 [Spodoptera frugiperda]|nr:hypothetical protein SFRURICE_012696 [Spodoptera frugiperda]
MGHFQISIGVCINYIPKRAFLTSPASGTLQLWKGIDAPEDRWGPVGSDLLGPICGVAVPSSCRARCRYRVLRVVLALMTTGHFLPPFQKQVPLETPISEAPLPVSGGSEDAIASPKPLPKLGT